MRTFGNFRGLLPNDDDTRYSDQFLNRQARRRMGRPIDDEGFTVPSVNIRNNDEKEYLIEMAAPGFEKSDFDITVSKGNLYVEAAHHHTSHNDTYTRREHNYSRLSRSFTLPETAIEDKIDARYQNGMLEIVVPVKTNADDAGTTKSIDIK